MQFQILRGNFYRRVHVFPLENVSKDQLSTFERNFFYLSLEFIRRNIDRENIKKETRQAKHVQVYDWIPMSRYSTLWMARAFMKFSMQFLSIYRRKHAQREFNHPLSIFQFFNFFSHRMFDRCGNTLGDNARKLHRWSMILL